MYAPQKYMTVEVLTDVLSEFDWPAPYQIEDDRPDYIYANFPRCTLGFVEGFESDMDVKFFAEDTGLDTAVTLRDVISVLGPFPTPNLHLHFSPHASLEKVKYGLRDLCTILLTHFRSSVSGDFSWSERYRAAIASR